MTYGRTFTNLQILLVLALGHPVAAEAGTAPSLKETDWPSFRGRDHSGISDDQPAPTSWDIEKGVGVLWKTPLPGLGHSSPIIAGDRIFLTMAAGDKEQELKVGLYGSGDPAKETGEYKWNVICLNRRTGAVEWERTAHQGVPRIKRHMKASHANCTPATDGAHLAVFFGSEGLHVFDLDGKLLWSRDLGVLQSGPYNAPDLEWGFASSPIIDSGRVYVQCDVLGQSFVAAYDIKTGKPVWRTDRQEVSTWSTPLAYRDAKRAVLIANGWKEIAGYDLDSGKRLWWMRGGGDVPVPTPVAHDGLIYIANAHGASAPLYAIHAGATGEIKPDSSLQVAWYTDRNGAYMQTPLVYRDLVFSCSDRGVLKCYDAATGKLHYRQRLGGGGSGFTASPVATNGNLYFTSETGDVYVVAADSKFELVATNELKDICMASPAVSNGTLYFRTRHHLVAIGDNAGSAETGKGERNTGKQEAGEQDK